MVGTIRRTRTLLAASLSMALAVLTAGCSDSSSSQATGPKSTGPAVPGRVHVDVADIDLTITGATAHLDDSGNGSLSMRVRNDEDVPEHLGMVAPPNDGRGELIGGKSAEGNGSLSTAAILLLSGTTVTFGGSGPRVLLHHVHGATARHTLPVTLQFGVAGLVRVQPCVTSS